MSRPAVGHVVVFNGEDHTITEVSENGVEFSNGGDSRGTTVNHLEELEAGRWGVIGRQGARPFRANVGVSFTPSKE